MNQTLKGYVVVRNGAVQNTYASPRNLLLAWERAMDHASKLAGLYGGRVEVEEYRSGQGPFEPGKVIAAWAVLP